MNILLTEIRRSLVELQMGLDGALNITDQMEQLTNSLSLSKVPDKWAGAAYFSKKSLEPWFVDMTDRCTQLDSWSEYLELPKCLWLSGLFNPMSFITAIMQTTARANNLPLDFMATQTNVTMMTNSEEVVDYPEEGRYIYGLFLEGAGWELGRTGNDGYLTESTLKDIHPPLPIVNVTAVPIEQKIVSGMYNCPVYVTSMRGPTFVFAANLKMESEESKEERWVLAGVALLMADD
jgi:dynein heavy chain